MDIGYVELSLTHMLISRAVWTIDANGSYFYDDTPVTFAQLQKRLETLDTNRTLLLRTDTRTPFGAFSRVMLLLKERGITRVSIATQER